MAVCYGLVAIVGGIFGFALTASISSSTLLPLIIAPVAGSLSATAMAAALIAGNLEIVARHEHNPPDGVVWC